MKEDQWFHNSGLAGDPFPLLCVPIQVTSLLRTSVGNVLHLSPPNMISIIFLWWGGAQGVQQKIPLTLEVPTGALSLPQWPGNKRWQHSFPTDMDLLCLAKEEAECSPLGDLLMPLLSLQAHLPQVALVLKSRCAWVCKHSTTPQMASLGHSRSTWSWIRY